MVVWFLSSCLVFFLKEKSVPVLLLWLEHSLSLFNEKKTQELCGTNMSLRVYALVGNSLLRRPGISGIHPSLSLFERDIERADGRFLNSDPMVCLDCYTGIRSQRTTLCWP